MTEQWHGWPQDGPDFDGDGTGEPDHGDAFDPDGTGFDDGPTAELGGFESDGTAGFGADAGHDGEPGFGADADPGPPDDALSYAGETGATESFGHLDDADGPDSSDASAPLGYADDHPYGPDADLPRAGMGPAGEVPAEAGLGPAGEVGMGPAGEPPAEAGMGPAGDAADTDPGSGAGTGNDDASGTEPDPQAGGEPSHEAGLGPAGDDPDPHPDVDDWPRAAPFGADPDLDPGADDWPAPEFPPQLELGSPPEPVDGPPWADPDLLGAGVPAGPGGLDADPEDVGTPADLGTAGLGAAGDGFDPPEPGGLAGYAGETLPDGADPWATLAGSEDPATSALARFWAPPRPD